MFAVLGLIMALVQGGYIRRKMAGKEKRLAVMVSFFFFIRGSSFQHRIPPTPACECISRKVSPW